MTIVYAKAAAAIVLSVLAMGLVERFSAAILRQGRDLAASVGIAALVRFGLFIAVFVIVPTPVPSDVPHFYYAPSVATLHGALWNIDYISSYSPLFPYLGAVLVSLWNDPRVFVVFALCLDTAGVGLWHVLLRRYGRREDALNVALCYALSAPVIFNAIVGQQQTWIGAGLALTLWLMLARKSTTGSALLQGVLLAASKALVPLFWPVLLALTARPLKWLATALLIPVAAVAVFAWLGSHLLAGMRTEQHAFTSGNIIYYVEYLSGHLRSLFVVYDLFTAATLLAAGLYLFLRLRALPRDNIDVVLCGLALLMILMLIVSKKSYANYLCFAYFPIVFVLYRYLPRAWYWGVFIVFSVAATISPSLWFANGGQQLSLHDWIAQDGWRAALPTVVVDWVLIPIYFLIAVLAFRATLARDAVRVPQQSRA
jgi:hypothetical protein